MDNLDFDNPGLKESLMQDGADMLENMGDEYNNEKVPKSGTTKVSLILLVIGYLTVISGIFIDNIFRYLLTLVGLIIGYHVFFEKNKEKTSYKFTKISRTFGAILLFVAVVMAFLYKYDVL